MALRPSCGRFFQVAIAESRTYGDPKQNLLTGQAVELVKEPPQARRGIDYAVAVFHASTGKLQQQQFDQLLEVSDEIAPNWVFEQRGSSPHYELVFANEIGIRLELTPVDSINARNKGGICFSLPGTCWWLQSTAQGALLLLRLSRIEGFKHFTRLDFQNTELNPEWPAERVGAAVDAGEIWVKGSTRFRDWQERDADGQPTNGITLYWNSSRSEKVGKTYNKAADAGWDTAAIRDEVQTRGRWAHAHGRDLVAELAAAHGSAEMEEVISRHTSSALLQHLEYWTLNGTSPKTDKNWKRKANPADWYIKRIGKRCDPIRKASKPLVDVETTVDYGVQQYGRHMVRWVHEMARTHELPEEFVVQSLYERFRSRLREEDLDWYTEGMTKKQRAQAIRDLEECKNEIAQAQERGWWAKK